MTDEPFAAETGPFVRTVSGARLHFGLFNVGGAGRQFGGLGMMVEDPGFELICRPAAAPRVFGVGSADQHARVRALLDAFAAEFGAAPAEIELRRAIPQHLGLGSGTQLAMATVDVLTELHQPSALFQAKHRLDWHRQAARLSGRGRRSGLGVFGYARGARNSLLIDYGRGDSDAPSTVVAAGPGHALELPVVLLMPDVPPGLNADAERQAFARPMPDGLADRLCRLALLETHGAWAEGDYAAFGEALHEFNRVAGEYFAAAQGGAYAHPLVGELIAAARALGVPAAGQSSWGPTVFALCPDEAAAARLAEEIPRRFPGVAALRTHSGARTIRQNGRLARRPELLVSVRSAEEAVLAYAADCRWIDMKEPSAGPLGRCSAATVAATAAALPPVLAKLSVACGELREAERADLSALVDQRHWQVLFKFGLAGERGSDDWFGRAADVAERARGRAGGGNVVIAAYADADRANAPGWPDVIAAAGDLELDYVLLDTFDKSHRVWDCMPDEELRTFLKAARGRGLKVALAGSLRLENLPNLRHRLGGLPDVIAIRGAACAGLERQASVSGEKVRQWRQALDRLPLW